MAITIISRSAGIDEIAAEMDRRGVVIEKLEAENAALKAERDQAVGALRPFAAAAGCWEETMPDETLVFGHYPSMFGGQTELRFADFRKARAIIAPPAAGGTDA